MPNQSGLKTDSEHPNKENFKNNNNSKTIQLVHGTISNSNLTVDQTPLIVSTELTETVSSDLNVNAPPFIPGTVSYTEQTQVQKPFVADPQCQHAITDYPGLSPVSVTENKLCDSNKEQMFGQRPSDAAISAHTSGPSSPMPDASSLRQAPTRRELTPQKLPASSGPPARAAVVTSQADEPTLPATAAAPGNSSSSHTASHTTGARARPGGPGGHSPPLIPDADGHPPALTQHPDLARPGAPGGHSPPPIPDADGHPQHPGLPSLSDHREGTSMDLPDTNRDNLRTPKCFYHQIPQYTPVPDSWPHINPHIWDESLSPLTQQCLQIYDVVRNSGIPNFAGARLPIPSSLNIPEWRKLIQEMDYPDVAIVDFLEFGFPLSFQGDFPLDSEHHRNHPSALDYPNAIDAFIEVELQAQALLGPFQQSCFSPHIKCSPLMTRPKSDSSERRIIMDFSWGNNSVNSHIDNSCYMGTDYKLSLPTVDSVADMILKCGPGCWIYKRDLSRAYKQLRTCPLAWPLTGFTHNSQLLADISVPFGVKPGGMMCQRTTDVISYYMHHQGYNMENYLDDFLGAETQKVNAIQADNKLGDTLDRLGVQHKKSKHCPPAQLQICLGIEFDSVHMTKAIPKPKLKEIQSELKRWIHKSAATKNELQSLAGKLLFVAKCSKPARLFINSILSDLRAAPDSGYTPLSEATLSDIHWFMSLMPLYNGISLIHHPPGGATIPVDLDACLTGVGCKSGSLYYMEELPPFITDLHLTITHLEMLNIVVATRLFASQWSKHTINLGCDNLASVAVLQSGKARDPLLAGCAKQIWLFATANDFNIVPFHRSGLEMQSLGIDALSRAHLSPKFKHLIASIQQNGTRLRVPPQLFALPPH